MDAGKDAKDGLNGHKQRDSSFGRIKPSVTGLVMKVLVDKNRKMIEEYLQSINAESKYLKKLASQFGAIFRTKLEQLLKVICRADRSRFFELLRSIDGTDALLHKDWQSLSRKIDYISKLPSVSEMSVEAFASEILDCWRIKEEMYFFMDHHSRTRKSIVSFLKEEESDSFGKIPQSLEKQIESILIGSKGTRSPLPPQKTVVDSLNKPKPAIRSLNFFKHSEIEESQTFHQDRGNRIQKPASFFDEFTKSNMTTKNDLVNKSKFSEKSSDISFKFSNITDS